MSSSADGSVNGKKDGRKRIRSFSSSKNLRRKSVRTPLKIREAHGLVDPEAFHLVEHRRVRRVRIDAVYPARCDDLERRLVMLHVAHLDRRGVRAQKQVFARRLQIKTYRASSARGGPAAD